MADLRGVMAALLTPFDGQQKLDKESLRRLVRFNISQGIDGLYVGGSTGESLCPERRGAGRGAGDRRR